MKLKTKIKEYTLNNKSDIFEGTDFENEIFEIKIRELSQKELLKIGSKHPDALVSSISLLNVSEDNSSKNKKDDAHGSKNDSMDIFNKSQEDIEKIDEDMFEFGLDIVLASIKDWSGMNDENGDPLPITKETLRSLAFHYYGFYEALSITIFNTINYSKKKL